MGRRIMAFDERGRVLYNNTQFLAGDIPQDEGIFIVDSHVVLNFYGRPDFLHSKERKHSKQNTFRIVVDGGDVDLHCYGDYI